MILDLCRIRRFGKSTYLLLTKETQRHTGWNVGDRIAIRPVGDKLILERVPLEELAKLRSSEVTRDDCER